MAAQRFEPTSDLGKRLMALIRHRGYSGLKEAAAKTGLSYQQLYDLMSGRKVPRIDTLERIVEQLGGTMRELYSFRIEGEPKPKGKQTP